MYDACYTRQSLAERWYCSVDIIDDLIRKGELKAFRVGRAVRISGAEVARFEGAENAVTLDELLCSTGRITKVP